LRGSLSSSANGGADRAAGKAGREIVEREVIYDRMWGHSLIYNDRSVAVFVHKLRRKLERASPGWRSIHTHFGVDYRLAPSRLRVRSAAA
jgi:DNA-binding response OmpR family regulator